MFTKKTGMLIAVALLAGGVVTLGGDVVDHLPEVQLAQAVAGVILLDELPEAEFEDICLESLFDGALPERLWLDDAGQIRSFETVQLILARAACLLGFAGSSFFELPEEGDDVLALFKIVSGETLTTEDGIIIDGENEAIRGVVVFPLTVILLLELLFGSFVEGPTPILGEDQCASLDDLVRGGHTLEIRWAAYFVSMLDLAIAADEGASQGLCHELEDGSLDELLSRARQGDLAAALHLGLLWDADTQAFLDGPDHGDPEARTQQSEKWKLAMLNHFGEPLVTLAATIPLIGLLVGMSATAS